MTNKTTFVVAALASAGFVSANSLADTRDINSEKDGALSDVKKLFEIMNKEHTYTLAVHGSHASHGSHGSHASHRSYYKPPEIDRDDLVDNSNPGIELAVARNNRSTPATSVLPNSPAISKKLKTLKGNSQRFKEIVAESQLALIAHGHNVGAIDGVLDARTRAAIFRFQSENGLPPDGKLTPEVLTALNITAQ